MKALVIKNPENCIQCKTCEDACSMAFYKSLNHELSCIRVEEIEKGKEILNVCTQCGKCEEVCPKFAISKNAKGVYVIDKEKCVGCMACVDICPNDVIVKSLDYPYASKCIACGICAKNCPNDVLAVEEI